MKEKSTKKPNWFFWSMILSLPFFLVLLCYPSCMNVREAANQMERQNNLKRLGLALHEYLDRNKCLPPSVVQDTKGKPLFSWCLLLLPYLDEEDLYKEFHLDEPWDSPHNLTLLPKIPNVFRLPNKLSEPGFTFYQVLVGPGTAFERPGLTVKDFPVGFWNTIFVVEAQEAVPWTKPVDLVYTPDGPLPKFYRDNIQSAWLGEYRWKGFLALQGDGHVRSISYPFEEAFLRAVIDRNCEDRSKFGF